ncbi:hypothetical protein E4U40_003324 [Claviceps sp. LM458 group G5]|nr:hypothetical protein E4U40_003324 [Claviceps sp. LM458 group G5]
MASTATGQPPSEDPHRPGEPSVTRATTRSRVWLSTVPLCQKYRAIKPLKDLRPGATQGTRAVSATKRSITEVEESQEQRTPTPRYVPFVARAPQPSLVPFIRLSHFPQKARQIPISEAHNQKILTVG